MNAQKVVEIARENCLTWGTISERVASRKGFSWACALVVDCLVGAIFLHLFRDIDLHGTVWPFVDERIGQLDQIIGWLTSNPAGLKLNEPLNTALASFFRYHIYLWHTFVQLLRVPELWQALPYTLACGISIAASVVVDLISIFSLHIMCFYIYAYRLFRLLFTSLASLWRAFRGKKWNPLRNRVDTAHLDSRQLFLATLFFVVLLFLAPTVTVYFFVFSTLHWTVRGIQFVVGRLALFQRYIDLSISRFRQE